MSKSFPSVPGAPLEHLHIGPLCRGHGDDLILLLRGVGWKHSREEILLYLDSSDGRGYFDTAERLVACTFCVPYPPRFGAVGIVVVDNAYRRRGLASNLVRWACEKLAVKGMAAMLTCREEVRAVYDQLGFQPVGRLRRVVLADPPEMPVSLPLGLCISEKPDLADLAAYDAVRFGGDRQFLLLALRAMDGARMLAAVNSVGAVHGYGCLHPGSAGSALGPLVAENDEIACVLASRLMADRSGPFHIDLLDNHDGLGTWLAPAGIDTFFPRNVMITAGGNPFAQQVYAITSLGFC